MAGNKTGGAKAFDAEAVDRIENVIIENVIQATLSLAAIRAAVKAAAVPVRTVDIDLAPFVEGAVLTLAELDAPHLFQVPADAEVIQRRNPQWPKNLALTVALLSLAHVAPTDPGQAAGTLYVEVARTNRRLLSHILKSYNAAFPESVSPALSEDEADAKND